MISSGQVSQMMSQQNQMFAGNAMYSQQISAQMPSMYPSSFGHAGFSYGSSGPMGYDFSSRASGGMMSAMGGAAQFALGAGSLMAGMGMIGGPMRYALDPFAGAGAMYRMGGSMGMGMGGRLAMGAAGMLPAMGLMAGAGHVIGSVMSGAQEQAGIERTLGQNFNFVNPSSGGRGFSRQQSMAIGDMVRGLGELPEMMTSVGELTRIMDRLGQMGIMNGVTNVRDFGTKFKGTLNVLREISKVVGSTMEEALPLFGEIRRSGVYSSADILKNAMQRQVVGGMTGMNQAQIGQVQMYGSQLGFASGGSRATGGSHALRIAGQLGMANQMGILSNDKIMELTGMEGAEGLQALSGQLTQAGYRMSRGALGTAMSIAMAEQSGGKFTGRMDQELIERFRRGDISKSEMLSMVRQKTGSRGSKMSYVANRDRLRSEMAGQMGVEGQMNMLQMVLGERGYDNPDALNIVSQNFGLDEREAGLLVDMGKKMPDINIEMRQRGRSEAKRIANESFMKGNFSWDAIKAKVGKRIEGVITEPFKQFGAELRNSINNTIDDFVDDITGRYKVEVTRGMSGLARSAGLGMGGSRQRLASMLSGGGAASLGRGVDMTPGVLGSAVNWLTGSQTAGERMAEVLRGTGGGGGGFVDASFSGGIAGIYEFGKRDRALMDAGYNRLGGGAYARSEDMAAKSKYLEQLATGTVLKEGSAADKQRMSKMLADPDFNAARAEMASYVSFGTKGEALKKLSAKYGENDVLGALATDTSGPLGGYSLELRARLAEKAGIMSFSPDKGQEIAGRIRGVEKGKLQGMFGAQGAEVVKDTIKDLQGSAGGEYILGAFTMRGGTESNISWNQRLADQLGVKSTHATKNNETIAATKAAVEIEGVVHKAKYGGTFDDKDKAVLKRMGYDNPDAFTKEEAEKLGKFISVMNKTHLSDDDKKLLASYRGDLGAAGIIEISQRITSQGRDVEGRARSLRRAGLKLGAEGEAMLGKIEAYAGKMSGMTNAGGIRSGFGIGGGTSYAEDIGQVAFELTQMKDQKMARRLTSTDDNLAIAYDQAQSVQRKIRRGGRGFEKFFGDDAETNAIRRGGGAIEGLNVAKAMYFDEHGQLRKGMEGDFTKFMASSKGQELMTAAGAEQRSKYASQADIAKNMENFGQSVATLATIVQQMKDGKTAGGAK